MDLDYLLDLESMDKVYSTKPREYQIQYYEIFQDQSSPAQVSSPLSMVSAQKMANNSNRSSEEVPQTRKKKRDNNTIFKTSLSSFRKSMIDIIKTRAIKWSIPFLRSEWKTKNMAVFPKLAIAVELLGVKKEVTEAWWRRAEKLLKDKSSLPAERLNELQKSINLMKQSLDCSNYQDTVNVYWGDYRQRSKHAKCMKQVKEFVLSFTKMIK